MNLTASYTDQEVPAITIGGETRALQRTYESGERVYILGNPLDAMRKVELPSVTTIIRRIYGNPFPEGAEPYLEHARARGNEVHRSIAMLSRGVELDWETVHHEVRPRLACFDHFRRETSWMPQYVETAFVSLRYGFAGSPDQVGYFDQREPFTFVLDCKPPTAWFVRLQLSFYAIAVKESLGLSTLPKRMPVYLRDDKPACHPILDRNARDRDRALSIMNTFNIGIEEGVWDSGGTEG